MHLTAIILAALAAVVALAAPPAPSNDGISTNSNATAPTGWQETGWQEPQWQSTHCSPHNHQSFDSADPDVVNIKAKWKNLCNNKKLEIGPSLTVYFKSGNAKLWMCNPYTISWLPCEGHDIDKIFEQIGMSCGKQLGGWVNLKRTNPDYIMRKNFEYPVGRDPVNFTDGKEIEECGLEGVDAEMCPERDGHVLCWGLASYR